MRQALALFGLVVTGFAMAYRVVGYDAAIIVAYGAIALMALMIAATFFWLWAQRTTPLALGMAYSWSGIGLVTGWWWAVTLLGRPVWAVGHPAIFAVLALYVVGAVLHFSVIHRSFGRHGASFLWPVAAAFGVSLLVYGAV